jgi:hypothetical protein
MIHALGTSKDATRLLVGLKIKFAIRKYTHGLQRISQQSLDQGNKQSENLVHRSLKRETKQLKNGNLHLFHQLIDVPPML